MYLLEVSKDSSSTTSTGTQQTEGSNLSTTTGVETTVSKLKNPGIARDKILVHALDDELVTLAARIVNPTLSRKSSSQNGPL